MIKKVLLGLLVIFLLVQLLPFIPIEGESRRPKVRELYVTHNQIHTGLLLPYGPDWSDFPEAKYIEFSWGDRDFFVNVPTWDKLTLGLTLGALFTPDPGFMHVDRFDVINVPASRLLITEDQYQRLRSFIRRSFLLQDGKVVQKHGLSFYGTDGFYESTVPYHAFHTCNNWVREALAEAGVKTGVWTYHKWGVLFHLPKG